MKLTRPLAGAIVSILVCVSVLAQKMMFQGRVIEVVDGGTVVVETQSKAQFVVKCQALTVPHQTEPFADGSKQRLSNLVLRQMVDVEYTKRSESGDLLGTIFLNGKDVCLNQVAGGLARVDPQALNNLTTSRRELYADTEAEARNSRIGVWTATTPTNVNETAASSVVAPNTQNNGAAVDVRGYFLKDGTYIAPHKRTAPDATVDDNWSTAGNVNPYTRKPGTKNWFARNWWIFPTVGALIGTSFLLRRSGGGIAGGIPCNDGTISQAQNRQGACSHHGGIR